MVARRKIQSQAESLQFDDFVALFRNKGVAGVERADLEGLWRKCIWLCGEPGRAEDLILDTLCKVAAFSPEEWPPIKVRRPWLKRVAHHLFLEQLKMAKRRRNREQIYARRHGVEASKRGVDEERALEADSSFVSPILLALHRVLRDQCTPQMQRVAELRAQKFRYKDIAKDVGVTILEARRMWGEVKRLARAISKNLAA